MTNMNRDDARQVCETELGIVYCNFGDAAASPKKADRVILFKKAHVHLSYARQALREHMDSDPRIGMLMATMQRIEETTKWNMSHGQTYKANADEMVGQAAMVLFMARSLRASWASGGDSSETVYMKAERVF